MDRLRVGVVGVGVMGRHHARVYSQMGGVSLVGVSDVSLESAEKVAVQYKTKAFSDYRDLIKAGVDAVTIAVPTTLHRKIALDFIDNGVHVLVEKPIADTLEAGREIIQRAKEKDVKLMVCHIERFNPIIPVLKKSI